MLAAVGAELTEQQKVQARYLAIMDQTRKEQGDLARTQDGFANQAKKAWGNFQAVLSNAGKAMEPLSLSLVRGVNTGLDSTKVSLAGASAGIGRFAAIGAKAFGGVASAFRTTYGAARSLFGTLTAGLMDLAGYTDATKLFADAWHATTTVWAAARQRAAELRALLAEITAAIADQAAAWAGYGSGVSMVADLWGRLRSAVTGAVEVMGAIVDHWSLIVEEAGVRAMAWGQDVVVAARWAGEAFGALIGWLGQNWKALMVDLGNAVMAFVRNAAANLMELGRSFWEYLQSGFDSSKFTPNFTPVARRLPGHRVEAARDRGPGLGGRERPDRRDPRPREHGGRRDRRRPVEGGRRRPGHGGGGSGDNPRLRRCGHRARRRCGGPGEEPIAVRRARRDGQEDPVVRVG